RVHSASQAQLVNVIAPIMTEPGGRAWKQTIFHPFALTSKHAKGEVLQVVLDSPTYATAKHGEVPLLDAVATHDVGTGEVAVFVVNRSQDAALPLSLDLRGAEYRLVEALTYANGDHMWQASADDDTSVLPTTNTSASVSGSTVTAELPPISWS